MSSVATKSSSRDWRAIEYVFAVDGEVYGVQWDGFFDKWFVLDTVPPERFDSLADAMKRAEEIAAEDDTALFSEGVVVS